MVDSREKILTTTLEEPRVAGRIDPLPASPKSEIKQIIA
jgi:hypothetical protein